MIDAIEQTLMSFGRQLVVFSRDRGVRRVLLIIAIVVLFSYIYDLFWVGPNADLTSNGAELSLKDFHQARNSLRQTFAQALGGAALLLGLYFTAKNLHTSQEGQLTDRFTKAINQLGEQGPEKLAIRLGGIYALGRIAEDSSRDRLPIIEILAAYVRTHAPWPEGPYSPDELSPSKTQPEPNNQSSPKFALDIQAVLTVLGRYPSTFMCYRPDLSNTDLRGAHLGRADLREAYLKGAHLEGAILREAYIKGAWLWETHLEGADLGRAHLGRVDFQGAHLDGAFFWATKLKGAKNLTVEQLSTVKTLYGAVLDRPLRKQIEQRFPYLLEKPQD